MRSAGSGRAAERRNNVLVERLWKSVKYEEVYLHALRLCCGGCIARLSTSPSHNHEVGKSCSNSSASLRFGSAKQPRIS
jgi:5-keto 4-deoxyuronate isomerase